MAKIYHDTSFYGTDRIECRLYHPGNAQVRQRNDQLHRGKDGKSTKKKKGNSVQTAIPPNAFSYFFINIP